MTKLTINTKVINNINVAQSSIPISYQIMRKNTFRGQIGDDINI